jgi:DNA invertase Pin-like site-specific DNA recombinase
MRVIGYLRVSTDRQAEQGLGLDVQERAIREWAKAEGHRLIGLARDEGISGSNGLDTRMGLLEALEGIRGGRAGGLVVYRLDRLARDLIVQEQLLAEIRRLGGEVHSTSRSESEFLRDDANDPSRKMIRQVLGAVSEWERSIIALRLRAGRLRKAERGGFAYGSPPYGYAAEGGELVPVESEQSALARMRQLRADGHSLREIGRRLEAESHKPRRGEHWSPASLRKILARL